MGPLVAPGSPVCHNGTDFAGRNSSNRQEQPVRDATQEYDREYRNRGAPLQTHR